MYNYGGRADYLVRSISKKSSKMYDENWLIVKKDHIEIFIPNQSYNRYSEIGHSINCFTHDNFFGSRNDTLKIDLKELYVDTILTDFKILEDNLAIKLNDLQKQYNNKFQNQSIKVVVQEKDYHLNFYFFVMIRISPSQNIFLKYKNLDFTDYSLNKPAYTLLQKKFKDKEIDISLEDIDKDFEDVLTQLKLLYY